MVPGEEGVSGCAAWRPIRPSASRNSRSARVAWPGGAGQARSTRRTSRHCRPSDRPGSRPRAAPAFAIRAAFCFDAPSSRRASYTLSSFTLGPGFARPGIVAHLSSSKPGVTRHRGRPRVTCRLGVPTRHPIEAQAICDLDCWLPAVETGNTLLGWTQNVEKRITQPRPSSQAAWTLSRQPMILRSFVSTLASSREICIWLMPSSAAMADWDLPSKNRSKISWRSSGSS